MAFIVTEYLGGGSLRALLDRGEVLSQSQALGVGLEAARALDYAHRRGFVHRDIKPANLLFGEEQRLRIADFGLARALAEAAWTEPQGAMLGTARYASPEQAKGEKLNGKADVYALALVMVEAVTGAVPFAADTTIGTLMSRVDKQLEVPDELGPLQGVLTRAGHPDPEQRIDARALAAGLLRAAKSLSKPAALPLAGALPRAGELLVDEDPTVHGEPEPRPERVPTEEDLDLDLTEEDLDLDPPDWVNQTSPAVAAAPLPDFADPTEATEATDPDVVDEIDADGAEAKAVDLIDGEAEDDDMGSGEAGGNGAGAERVASIDAEPGREKVSVIDLRFPLDGVPHSDDEAAPAIEPAATAAPVPDRALVGAGVAATSHAPPSAATAAYIDTDPETTDGADDPETADDRIEPVTLATATVVVPPRPAEPPATDESGRRRRWPWVVVALALLAGGGVAANGALAEKEPPATERTVVLPVPALVNRSQETAEAVARAAGWKTTIRSERRDGTLVGQVIATTPTAGSRLEDGGSIELVVSSGQTVVDVPTDLAGKPLADVTARLEALGLKVVTSATRVDEDVAEGSVIGVVGSTPPTLERGSTVEVVVSSGPPPRDVPSDLAGRSLADATARIEALGLKAETGETRFDEDVAEGTVIGVAESTPATLEKGSTVRLVVSGGPRPRSIPSVIGETEAAATEEITAQQLEVAVNPQFNPTVAEGEVASQIPRAGAEVPRGTTITIEVSRGPEQVPIPDITDAGTPAEAAAILRAEGLVPGSVSGSSEGSPVGTSPSRGTDVDSGASVDILLG